VTFFIQTFFIHNKVYTFLRDKIYTVQNFYSNKIYTQLNFYGNKIYMEQNLYKILYIVTQLKQDYHCGFFNTISFIHVK
jgi:hypothetical protein